MRPDLEDPAAAASAAGRVSAGVYVYGVTTVPGRTATAGLRGVGEPPAGVRAVEGGDLAALVSDVAAGWTAARREDVQAHDEVLSRTIESETIVPMRFGVVMDSDDHVRQ